MFIFRLITYLALVLMSGALWGLIPLLVGKSTGKPELGKLGMLCSILANLIFLGVVAAVAFLIAILVRKDDIGSHSNGSASYPLLRSGGGNSGTVNRPASGLDLYCVSGPLRGQVYPVGRDGLLIGRGPNCGLRLPEGTAGISREHCTVCFQQGVPVLIDLNSSYGTFQGDGSRIPPHYPVQMGPGSRFSLGGTDCCFQLTVR